MTPINWWNPLQLGQRCPVFWTVVEKFIKDCQSHASKPMEDDGRFSRGAFPGNSLDNCVELWELRNVGWCKVIVPKATIDLKK